MPKKSKRHIEVMISSTSKDLPDHRKGAMDATWRCKMFPLVMEILPSSSADAIDASLEMVDQADVYVGIIANRYGHVPKDSKRNRKKISITEMEYRRAVERGIPILLFIMDESHLQVAGDIERDPENYKKLEDLKNELKDKYVVSFFKSAEELRVQVLHALTEVKDKIESEDEEESEDDDEEDDESDIGIPPPPKLYAVPPYSLTNRFIGRMAELKELDAWAEADEPMMMIEAIGGMGKSALTWEWVQERAAGFDGIFWYSFYAGGATMNSFIRHALAYITQQKPDDLKNMPYDERANKLLTALQGGRWLLVLDGFERALVAYHRWNAAQMRDETVGDDDDQTRDLRVCTDPRDGEFLLKLAGCNKSKMLVSSRLMPRRLGTADDPIPGVCYKELAGLHPEDARRLMSERGVKTADRDRLDRFMKQLGYHSLLLKMIAGRVKNFRRGPGDFDKWYAAEGKTIHLSELDIKQNRTHILQYAFAGLDETKRKLLSQVAAFSDAVGYDTLAVFNPYLPEKPGEVRKPDDAPFDLWMARRELERAETDEEREKLEKRIAEGEAQLAEAQAAYEAYQKALDDYYKSDDYRAAVAPFDAALTELEERGLLQWNRKEDRYDLHPVVRGYSFDQLEGDEKTQTFERIRDHFASLPPEDVEKASEISDLQNTIAIYKALLGAGRLEDAAAFYSNRLSDVLLHNVAAFHTAVELLAPFFPDGIDRLPALSVAETQSPIVTSLGAMFFNLGLIEEALTLYKMQLKLKLKLKDTSNLGVGLRNYAEALETDNQLAAGLRACELARELAEVVGSKNELAMTHLYLLIIFKDSGRWAEVDTTYASFNANPPIYGTESEQSRANMRYAESLFLRGADATELIENTETLAQKSRTASVLWRIQWLRGEVALKRGQPGVAAEYFQNALKLARKAGSAGDTQGFLGALARARAQQGHYEEAREIVEQGVPSIDAAEVYLTLGERGKAEEYAIEAYKHAWADGPPHSWWWGLERAKKVLDELGVPYPEMPPFDPAKVKPIPYEDEIRAFIAELKAKKDAKD